MPSNHRLSELHKRLADRQWREIRSHMGSLGDEFQGRRLLREQTGILVFQTATATSGVTSDDLKRYVFAAQSDPRFAFLGGLPGVAMMYNAIGIAFQDGFFGSSSNTVGETTTLNGVIARVIDSLVDDIPKLIAPERAMLFRLLGKQAWLEPTTLPSDEELDIKHPAVSLLYKFIRGWITKVKGSPCWNDLTSSIRDDFSSAVEAALSIEYDTIDCVIPANSQDYNPDVRRILLEKSRNTFWIPAITPALFLGWPEGLDKTAYQAGVHRFGDLIGWLDDTMDLIEDIDKGEANELLLDLYENAGKPPYSTHEEFQMMIVHWLSDDRTVAKLVTKAAKIYTDTIKGFESLRPNTTALQQLSSDLTRLSLESVGAE